MSRLVQTCGFPKVQGLLDDSCLMFASSDAQHKTTEAPMICRLGSPRKVPGDCNTFHKIWVVRINHTEHQISIRRKLSQKLVVKCDGQTLLDKRYIFSKPPPGHCFVAFTSVGVSFAIYYQAVTTRLGRGTCQNLSSLRTNADHYELLVDGLKFMDLLDGSLVKTPHRRPLVENALKRLASIPPPPAHEAPTAKPGHGGGWLSRRAATNSLRATAADRRLSDFGTQRDGGHGYPRPRFSDRFTFGMFGRARSVNFLYDRRGDCYGDCLDSELRRKLTEVSDEEGVDEV